MSKGLWHRKMQKICSGIIIFCVCLASKYSFASYDDAKIIWLDFKLPPYYDKERKEIMKVYQQIVPEQWVKKWSKIKNFNFDAMAVADLDGDGKPDVTIVLIDIIKSYGSFSARFARFEIYKGKWHFSGEEASTGDLYYIKDKLAKTHLVHDGCVVGGYTEDLKYYSGPIKNTTRDGKWLPYFMGNSNAKIISIVKKELRKEIAEENRLYKEYYKTKPSRLRVSGVLEDINGDGNKDIIVRMNDINRGPGMENPQPPFCDDGACDYYLLVNKTDNIWQKELIGRTTCVGLSKPDSNGIRRIYTDQTTLMWDGIKFKHILYKPNWMLKQPVNIEEINEEDI